MSAVHHLSVVIPVYRGETSLPGVLAELAAYTTPTTTPGGRTFQVDEVLLVHDRGPDDSARILREAAATHAWVRPLWLSRNFGQHSATLAGCSASVSEWVVTMDEDGQHDPAALGAMLDVAMAEQADLVYAKPTNPSPHSSARRAASSGAKWLTATLGGRAATRDFHSFRLLVGEIARSVAAYAGPGIYLDVALHWVVNRVATCPVAMRTGSGRESGYRWRTLLSHFWRLVLSSGTLPLRLVSIAGAGFAVLAVITAIGLAVARLASESWTIPGWTSIFVALLFTTGLILFGLGVVAEYVGVAVNMAMGRPLYLAVRDPLDGPLGKDQGDAPPG